MSENTEGFNYYLKEKWKLLVTLFSLFVFLTMGFHLEISGSTMFQLSLQVETNLGELGWIVAARSFGYMLSVILFGIIFQSLIKNHSELILSISYLFPAAATISTPHIKSLWLLCIALFFQGMSQGLTDLGINTLITTMWKDRSTAPLNSVYLGYPIGALLSIFLVRIYRSNDSINSSSELIIPYRIASIFCIISSIGFGLISYKQSKTKKKEDLNRISVEKEEINIRSKPKRLFWKSCSPTTCGEGYIMYGFILISLLFLFNFFFGGIEQSFTKFFISFIESENVKDSLYSMIFYWFPMLIGRIISTFLTAIWLSPEIMLTISLIFHILTYIFWLIFIWYIGLTKLIVFVLVSLTGLSISSISPTLIGWIKQFLSLNPIEITYLLTSNAFGGIVFGLISGYIFKYLDKKHLFTLLILNILLFSIIFLLIVIIQFIHSKEKDEEIKV